MTANTSPIFELTVTAGSPQTFTSADTTSKKTIATGGTNGTRIDSIKCATDDTTTVNLAFYISVSGTDYYIGNVNLPIGSGYTSVAGVEALATLTPNLGYLALPASALLKVNCVATMTAAKTTTIVPFGGDY